MAPLPNVPWVGPKCQATPNQMKQQDAHFCDSQFSLDLEFVSLLGEEQINMPQRKARTFLL